MHRKPSYHTSKLKDALEGHGLRVLVEVGDGHKHIDLAIPDAHINIEVDGPQHLTNPNQILSDIDRAHYSDLEGYSTIHIPNALIDMNLPDIASAIAKAAKVRAEKFDKKSLA